MELPTYQDLLDAGVHFGHLRKKWNPHMAPYIFMERNGIHIIDLNKTQRMLDEAARVARQLAFSGRKILFVATKKQAREIVEAEAKRVNMPYVTERWLGGMLTNFATVRKSIKTMKNIEKMRTDGTWERLNKKERLMLSREQAKLEKVLGGIADLSRLPSALFIVDIKKEHIAVAEAQNLAIPTIAMVDTNSNPNQVDFPVPANDDATKSIQLIMRTITDAIIEGTEERKRKREDEKVKKEADRQRGVEVVDTKEEEEEG
ncbi:MAG: 30S ribosomal protein S2 [Bacteroidetes bacterium]|jgi:small subunit ribosomal protein S2|nr:MAG: 30S ribosomal protein S2 [Bacteroidota bacterium]